MKNWNLAPTSTHELYKLCDDLKIKDVVIIRKGQLKHYLKNKNITNIIINLDDIGSGSHWVALNKRKKLYFDSYAQPSPQIIKNYAYNTHKEIQLISDKDCGPLCCLWLYYVNYDDQKNFYKLFNDLY